MKKLLTTTSLMVAAIGVACSGGDASSATTAQSAAPPSVARTSQAAPETVRADFSFDGTFRQGGVVRGQAPAGTRSLTLDGTAIPLTAEGNFLIGFGRDHGGGSQPGGPIGRRIATIGNFGDCAHQLAD